MFAARRLRPFLTRVTLQAPVIVRGLQSLPMILSIGFVFLPELAPSNESLERVLLKLPRSSNETDPGGAFIPSHR